MKEFYQYFLKEFGKLVLSNLNLKTMLIKITSPWMLNIIAFVLVLNLYFGNILKLPMKNLDNTIHTFISFRSVMEESARTPVKEIAEVCDNEEFAVGFINLELTNTNTNPVLVGKYLGMFHWDKNKKRLSDARFLLGERVDDVFYTAEQTSNLLNVAKIWENGVIIFERDADYQANAGSNVPHLMKNYWFPPHSRIGTTYIKNKDNQYAVRIVIMLSKEAFDKGVAKKGNENAFVDFLKGNIKNIYDNFSKIEKVGGMCYTL
jgi:hypothetical protein